MIAGPLLLFVLIDSLRRKPHSPSLAFLFKAGAVAFVVAASWWLRYVGPALRYARYARDWTRSSLGTPSLTTWAKWLNTVLQGLVGHGVSIVIALVAILALWQVVFRKQTILDSLQRRALLACACAGLPLILAQLSGTNHLLRHISPVMIPLAITMGVLAEATGWLGSKPAMAISCVLFLAQLAMLVGPVWFPNRQPLESKFVNANGGVPWLAMIRFDQWDWKPLKGHRSELQSRHAKDRTTGERAGLKRSANLISLDRLGRAFSRRNLAVELRTGADQLATSDEFARG